MLTVHTYEENKENQLPVISLKKEQNDILSWFKHNKKDIEQIILQYGGILFKETGLSGVSDFNRISQVICPDLLEYVYRSTPRTMLGGRIYTATEYPADKTIPQHNENAYSRNWPSKLMFFSVLVAKSGGETPVTSSSKVYQNIDQKIRKKFEDKQVLYVRNYQANLDLSWQDVFQTEDKSAVEIYCKEHDIEYEWKSKIVELTTRQVCQASIIHSITQQKVWFNQAHLFHISGLAKEDREYLIKTVGENNLPRNAFYGDGTEFDVEDLEHIRNIYKQEQITFNWQKGDIMILDNVLMTHGRNPYAGERKVAVAMG